MGEAGFILPGGTLGYRIDFENDRHAGAPAQFVTIQDSLDAALDWATLELTEVGWGDRLVAIPPGRQHCELVERFTQDGKELELRVELDFDRESGRLSARFQTLDPVTGLPPAVQFGFLPPEDGAGSGQGHISYLARARSDLTTGVRIPNVAVIQFDLGEVIATHQVDPHDPAQGVDPAKEFLNVVDAGAPTSRVLALPDVTPTREFTVSWSGTDGPGESGIAGYDIFVSDDGNPWVPWLLATPQTQAPFTGTMGRHYEFYSVAIDRVGNRETAPLTADAQTTLSAEAPLRIAIIRSGDSLVLRWESSAEHHYTVESTSELDGHWTPVTGAVSLAGTGEPIQFPIGPAVGVRFYRVMIDP